MPRRAKPLGEVIAALYDQGRVRHLGHFPELESQMLTWTGAPGERSPDVLDSAVWAMSEFAAGRFGPPPERIGPEVHRYTKQPTPGVHRWHEDPTEGVYHYG